MPRNVFCQHEQHEAEGLDFAPWPGELGQRVFAGIGKPGRGVDAAMDFLASTV